MLVVETSDWTELSSALFWIGSVLVMISEPLVPSLLTGEIAASLLTFKLFDGSLELEYASSISSSSLDSDFPSKSSGFSFERFCFFHFMRRFWYQVLTCSWVRPSSAARPTRSEVDRYFLVSNSRSKRSNCPSVNTWKKWWSYSPFYGCSKG